MVQLVVASYFSREAYLQVSFGYIFWIREKYEANSAPSILSILRKVLPLSSFTPTQELDRVTQKNHQVCLRIDTLCGRRALGFEAQIARCAHHLYDVILTPSQKKG